MYAVWPQNLTILSLCLLLPALLPAQEPVIAGRLPAIRLELKEKHHFFLADVVDSRREKGTSLGHVVHLTRRQPLNLPGNLENVAYDFWEASLPGRGQHLVPVVAKINTLSFSEAREAPGKVRGESAIAVRFVWNRGPEEVFLTAYNAKGKYTRPESKPVHDEFLVKMLSDAMMFFDKWMTANNGKNPALVRGIRLIVEHESGPAKADTVFYSPDRPLQYGDFKAPPKAGRYAAMVFTSISYEGSSRVKDNYLEVLVRLKVYLVKSMSWIRPESKNPKVLKHEQTHFDIARISADRFRKKLDGLELTIEDHDSQIQYQFLESYREMHQLQELYDKETRHGLNPEEQRKWEDMVKDELNGTAAIRVQ